MTIERVMYPHGEEKGKSKGVSRKRRRSGTGRVYQGISEREIPTNQVGGDLFTEGRGHRGFPVPWEEE